MKVKENTSYDFEVKNILFILSAFAFFVFLVNLILMRKNGVRLSEEKSPKEPHSTVDKSQ